jgi:molybdopterin synthase catalytic subunit
MLSSDHRERSPTLRIAVFAGMADLVGGRTVEMPWSGGTVADARRLVAERHPPAATLLSRSAFAVGSHYVADDAPLAADDDVAIIPPVSGG